MDGTASRRGLGLSVMMFMLIAGPAQATPPTHERMSNSLDFDATPWTSAAEPRASTTFVAGVRAVIDPGRE